jgi:hypothetical protein
MPAMAEKYFAAPFNVAQDRRMVGEITNHFYQCSDPDLHSICVPDPRSKCGSGSRIQILDKLI